jgi:HEAT repeat protein
MIALNSTGLIFSRVLKREISGNLISGTGRSFVMKVSVFSCLFFMLYTFSALYGQTQSVQEQSVPAAAGASEVPAAKHPVKPTAEQIAALESSPDSTNAEKKRDTLKFGLEADISDLIDTLTKTSDVRFVDDIYDLFHTTKSSIVRQKILQYFTTLKDPCLEDYAVTILNDPYDQNQSDVSDSFHYIQAVKTTAAVPAVLKLLESENSSYFNDALATLGAVGGPEEASYIAGYLDRTDLTTAQRQALVQVLGKIKAVSTYDRLVALARNKDENTYVRMYAAEAIGSMDKTDAIPVLIKLYEDPDPNVRTYVIKGLSHFSDPDAVSVIVEAVRDSYYKVRLEAIAAVKVLSINQAIPSLMYRVKNDPEPVVSAACYPVIAGLNTAEGNTFLVGMITDKAVADTTKAKVAAALLEQGKAGDSEIIVLAGETLKDERRKTLRYALGKEFAKYGRPEYAKICGDYIASSDVATQGTGLDIYARGRYAEITPKVQALAEQATVSSTNKSRNVNAEKAQRILGQKQ